jgi:hypothetical protein
MQFMFFVKVGFGTYLTFLVRRFNSPELHIFEISDENTNVLIEYFVGTS